MKTFNVFAFCSVRNTARFWVCFVLCARDNNNKKKIVGFFAMPNFAVEAQLKLQLR